MRNNLWARLDGGDWEWIDEVENEDEKESILQEYKMAFGDGWAFRWRREGND